MSTSSSEPVGPQKIAILGGGLASLTAAFELTRPGINAGQYEVTIYQMGWRLGGKGASGRNSARDERIEEHGLHVWLGFYENAFRLMREVMAEWSVPTDHPWAGGEAKNRWEHAFKPHDFCPLAERRPDGWEIWPLKFPRRHNGTPGDGGDLSADLIETIRKLVGALLEMARGGAAWLEVPPPPGAGSPLFMDELVESLFGDILTLLKEIPGERSIPELKASLQLAGRAAQFWIASNDSGLRRLGLLLNLGWALVQGLLSNAPKIIAHSLDVLDGCDLREFLARYGATAGAVRSPVISAIYDALFACEDGDPEKEKLAAGAGLRCLLRIFFSYKHALAWKMQAGMGDTVFTPLYRVLKARGVHFRFFHEVQHLELSPDKKRIARVRLTRQVTLNDPTVDYAPFREVKKLECWPHEPRWDQIDPNEVKEIQDGDINLEQPKNTKWPGKEQIDLRDGEHFHRVVLGIPVGALPGIASELIAENRCFRQMVEKLKTVRTAAYQAWLKKDLPGLGWNKPCPVLSNFLDPLNTWAAMTHLLKVENVPGHVRHLAYFCGPWPENKPPADVSAAGKKVLDELANSFWPGASKGGKFDPAILEMEFARANTYPSNRYTLSLPGTTEFRLRAGESGFANLVLAGDWTRNPLNVGCIEATVMSGMAASQAISGHPLEAQITGSQAL